jgi:hypothetical protein
MDTYHKQQGDPSTVSDSDSGTTSTSQGEQGADVASAPCNFKALDYDFVFNTNGERINKPGHVLMRTMMLEYLSTRKFVKGTMKADAPLMMEHIKRSLALLVRGKGARAPSLFYKKEDKKNGQARYIEATPSNFVTYVRQQRKDWLDKAKASDNSRFTATVFSQSLATLFAEAEAPITDPLDFFDDQNTCEWLLGDPHPVPTPRIRERNSLVTLASTHLGQLKIDDFDHEKQKQAELYKDFLTGFVENYMNPAFGLPVQYAKPTPMLQVMYTGVKKTFELLKSWPEAPTDSLPPLQPFSNLFTLASTYLDQVTIDSVDNDDDDKAQTELFQDFLSGFMVKDGTTAFLEQIPKYGTPTPMLQCMYQGMQDTFEGMFKVYQGFETTLSRNLTPNENRPTGTPPGSPGSAGSSGSSHPDGRAPGSTSTSSNRSTKRKGGGRDPESSTQKHAKTATSENKEEDSTDDDGASQEVNKYHAEDNADDEASESGDDANDEDSDMQMEEYDSNHSLLNEDDTDDLSLSSLSTTSSSDEMSSASSASSFVKVEAMNDENLHNKKDGVLGSLTDTLEALTLENQDILPPEASAATQPRNGGLGQHISDEYLQVLYHYDLQNQSGIDEDEDDDEKNCESLSSPREASRPTELSRRSTSTTFSVKEKTKTALKREMCEVGRRVLSAKMSKETDSHHGAKPKPKPTFSKGDKHSATVKSGKSTTLSAQAMERNQTLSNTLLYQPPQNHKEQQEKIVMHDLSEKAEVRDHIEFELLDLLDSDDSDDVDESLNGFLDSFMTSAAVTASGAETEIWMDECDANDYDAIINHPRRRNAPGQQAWLDLRGHRLMIQDQEAEKLLTEFQKTRRVADSVGFFSPKLLYRVMKREDRMEYICRPATLLEIRKNVSMKRFKKTKSSKDMLLRKKPNQKEESVAQAALEWFREKRLADGGQAQIEVYSLMDGSEYSMASSSSKLKMIMGGSDKNDSTGDWDGNSSHWKFNYRQWEEEEHVKAGTSVAGDVCDSGDREDYPEFDSALSSGLRLPSQQGRFLMGAVRGRNSTIVCGEEIEASTSRAGDLKGETEDSTQNPAFSSCFVSDRNEDDFCSYQKKWNVSFLSTILRNEKN